MKLERSFVILCLCAATALAGADNGLVVHEWGTFTSLQDENGNVISGINTDDEPVPAFVHDIAKGLLIRSTEAPPSFFQGAPACHPDVTMRLETPVIYFHPGKNFKGPVDMNVQFPGGWLTQYFPDAVVAAPGVSQNKFGALTEKTVGALTWNGITLNAQGAGPATDAHVWTAPRQVDSSMLQVGNGEREKFLFYRGVAHCNAPVRVIRTGKDLDITLPGGSDRIERLWITDVRPDGTAAFRALVPSGQVIRTSTKFREREYSGVAINGLMMELRTALVSAGLFADEADALLETWSLPYFKSTGVRLFFLVPPAWTDSHLPLTISPKADVTRVMVARVELVTPAQRALLAKIAAGPADSCKRFRDQFDESVSKTGHNQDWSDLDNGRKTFAALGFAVPELYRDYLDLGRFRNALILDEQKRKPTAELDQFIKNFHLAGYKY